jgi:glycosyltransferase involved in cell wall biosynthesis
VIGRWRRLATGALDRRFGRVDARLDALAAQLAATQASVEALGPVLRTLAADDPGHRRRLHALRADPGYAAAWDEPDPLVTISIPTRSRPRLLVERSLASALAQTYERLEVLVIGDAAGPEIEAAVTGVGDPRVRYVNLTHQFVRDDGEHWLTAATLTRNEAYRLARGRWLVDLDDDDALRPGALADLLAHARAERLEVAYGVLEEHDPGGATKLLGGFPPAHGQFGWQGAVVHAGLRFFERELVASDLGWSGDWFRVQRMLRAGVRIGHLERVTCDYYPSFLWGAGD